MMQNRIVNMNLPQCLIINYPVTGLSLNFSTQHDSPVDLTYLPVFMTRLTSVLIYECTSWFNHTSLNDISMDNLTRHIYKLCEKDLVTTVMDMVTGVLDTEVFDDTVYAAVVTFLLHNPDWLVSVVYPILFTAKSLALYSYIINISSINADNLIVHLDYTIAPIGYYKDENFIEC